MSPIPAVQLQKTENNAPELAEFDHLREHFEPYLRRGQAHAASVATAPVSSASTTSAAVAAASAALSSSSLLKDISTGRYGNVLGFASKSRALATAASRDAGARDELDKYDALFPANGSASKGKARSHTDWEQSRIDVMRRTRDVEEVASVEKRWTASWKQPLSSA